MLGSGDERKIEAASEGYDPDRPSVICGEGGEARIFEVGGRDGLCARERGQQEDGDERAGEAEPEVEAGRSG